MTCKLLHGDGVAWQGKVPTVEIDSHAVTQSYVVVPKMDAVRSLFSALHKLPDMEVVGLNFSSATTPELILKTFEQHCEYRRTRTA